MRKNLRRKFRKTENRPIECEVVTDISPYVDEGFPLYRQTLGRSELKFEELTKLYLCELGRRMNDRARFFLWRKEGRIIAFASTIVHQGVLRDNYIGLDYSVALDQHLYFVTWRDTIIWALKNGIHTYHSAPLNYDPKYHFRMELEHAWDFQLPAEMRSLQRIDASEIGQSLRFITSRSAIEKFYEQFGSRF